MNMKEQIETLDALYQECERVFLANGFADDSAKAFNTVQMKKDANNGLMVELRSNIVVDYDLSTTTAAQWRIAKGGQVNRHFIYEEVRACLSAWVVNCGVINEWCCGARRLKCRRIC